MQSKSDVLTTLLLLTASPVTRGFFKETIEELENYALLTARSDEEANDFLRTSSITFIIIDEKTPNLEPISFCRKIRDQSEYEKIPILIITSHLKKSLIRNLLKAGASDFLREPLDKTDFLLRMEMAKEQAQIKEKMAFLVPHSPFSSSAPALSLEERDVLDDRAAKSISNAIEDNIPLSLLILEMDHVDKFLHARGEHATNTLLLSLEERLKGLIRGQDILFNQKRGKFILILPATSSRASYFIAENIQESLALEPFSVSGMFFTLTISIGIANFKEGQQSTKSPHFVLDRLLTTATEHLNRAKEKGNSIISNETTKEV